MGCACSNCPPLTGVMLRMSGLPPLKVCSPSCACLLFSEGDFLSPLCYTPPLK